MSILYIYDTVDGSTDRREVITGRKVSEGKREVSIGDRMNIGSGCIKTWVLGKKI
jgi:hypothetical protein